MGNTRSEADYEVKTEEALKSSGACHCWIKEPNEGTQATDV